MLHNSSKSTPTYPSQAIVRNIIKFYIFLQLKQDFGIYQTYSRALKQKFPAERIILSGCHLHLYIVLSSMCYTSINT